MDLGLFMMPLHPPHRAFGDVLREDGDKIVLADQLGFAEAWVGEHYTASTEPITSPLIFMANLISRTKNIKFCTGVINMPNHHPAIVAGDDVDLGVALLAFPPRLLGIVGVFRHPKAERVAPVRHGRVFTVAKRSRIRLTR